MSNPQKDLTDYTDDELLRLLDHDYKAALTTLYDRYAIDLYIYIKSILLARTSGGRTGNDAQQILIDVFISLTYHLPPTDPPTPLVDHLFARAQQTALDHANSRNSKSEPRAST
jgi:DNA-directed RNA polymerase specialized sigma24 family protein